MQHGGKPPEGTCNAIIILVMLEIEWKEGVFPCDGRLMGIGHKQYNALYLGSYK